MERKDVHGTKGLYVSAVGGKGSVKNKVEEDPRDGEAAVDPYLVPFLSKQAFASGSSSPGTCIFWENNVCFLESCALCSEL